MAINLLFSINAQFVDQLCITLMSLVENTGKEDYRAYVIHDAPLDDKGKIEGLCQQLGIQYNPILINPDDFKDAPTSDRYPATIYYRLLAHEYLPNTLDKILYLDADLLIINSIRPLYDLSMENHLYAAASHVEDSNIMDVVNKVRLGNRDLKSYVNSGVLLMNLELIRQEVSRSKMMDYISQRGPLLFLPDQDVLNSLYSHRIQLVKDELYNLDVRYVPYYTLKSGGTINLDWIMKETVVLHFCGRDKPWKADYKGTFASIYKHYEVKMQRLVRSLGL